MPPEAAGDGAAAAAGQAQGGAGDGRVQEGATGEEVVLTVEYYHARKRLKLGEFEV